MIVFPAVDIKDGKAVRLRQGKKTEVDIFSDDPLEMAFKWQNQGAKWLHVIDLDGAFDGVSPNIPIINKITSQIKIPIQIGGGIRTLERAKQYLDAGASRLIVSTVALEDPELYNQMLNSFPGKVGVSIDADHGIIRTKGWLKDSGYKITDMIPLISNSAFLIYTDIERDGMHTGINSEALKNILAKTTLPVIAAGGISTMADIKKLADLKTYGNLAGIVTGRAIYEGTLDLAEAQKWLDNLAS